MNILVDQKNDGVSVKINNLHIDIPYSDAFIIAQNLCVAANHVMRMAGEHGFKHTPDILECKTNTSRVKRRTNIKKFKWRIDVKPQDENVYFYVGNIEISLHFTDAYKLSTNIRFSAKQAKAWAGDRSKVFNAIGILTNAEENYKLGV